MGHRRFLEADHRWRFDKKAFDNTIEIDPSPKWLSVDDVLQQIGNFEDKNMARLRVKGSKQY